MKNLKLFLFITIISTLLFISCDDDSKDDDPMDIMYASWLRTVIDVGGVHFNAELHINENQTIDFIVLDSTSHRSNFSLEFTLNADTMNVFNDFNCTGDGFYVLAVTTNTLTLEVKSDSCLSREMALKGNWQKIQ